MDNPTVYLLRKKIFLPLFLTQFFGAFNDNAFKLAILTLISYYLSSTQAESEYYQAIAGALFILPFFLLSATAGQLADKYDKARLSVWVKIFEVLLMMFGGLALYEQSIFLMMATLTGLGIHSTFFGPIKYAILPELLPRSQLLKATALIEASTFLAILLGTTFGALAIGNTDSHIIYAVILTNMVALLGLGSSLFIPTTPPKLAVLSVDWNICRATCHLLKETLTNNRLLAVILAISWFWLVGAVMLTKLPDYMHFVLRAEPAVFAVFLALFSIGIACGSLAISYLLAGQITLRFVPLSMLLLSLFALDLYFASPSSSINDLPLQSITVFFSKFNQWRITCDFFLFSFCGGLFIVPLYTDLQVTSDETMRARTIATNNIINSLCMVVGTLYVMLLLHFQYAIVVVFLTLAILNTCVAISFGLFLYRSRDNQSWAGKKSV